MYRLDLDIRSMVVYACFCLIMHKFSSIVGPLWDLLGHWQQELPHLITDHQVVVVDDHGLLAHNMYGLARTQRMLTSRQQLLPLLLLLLCGHQLLAFMGVVCLPASVQAVCARAC
jgi:hypothetical protein